MSDNKILYQIKTLEKMILRTFWNDKELEDEILIKKEFKPTPTQMQIIEYILEHINEVVYQKDLEEVLNLRRATVSGVLQTMEKNELIERTTNTEDTRVKKIILHEKAKRIFFKHAKELEDMEKIIIKDISENDLEIFSKVIKQMKVNIEQYKS